MSCHSHEEKDNCLDKSSLLMPLASLLPFTLSKNIIWFTVGSASALLNFCNSYMFQERTIHNCTKQLLHWNLSHHTKDEETAANAIKFWKLLLKAWSNNSEQCPGEILPHGQERKNSALGLPKRLNLVRIQLISKLTCKTFHILVLIRSLGTRVLPIWAQRSTRS